uniref:Uncharacterized protein n=1 Tax=Cucumis melo TaxID=3656 RepID=A0A9I9E7H7_CUCME
MEDYLCIMKTHADNLGRVGSQLKEKKKKKKNTRYTRFGQKCLHPREGSESQSLPSSKHFWSFIFETNLVSMSAAFSKYLLSYFTLFFLTMLCHMISSLSLSISSISYQSHFQPSLLWRIVTAHTVVVVPRAQPPLRLSLLCSFVVLVPYVCAFMSSLRYHRAQPFRRPLAAK